MENQISKTDTHKSNIAVCVLKMKPDCDPYVHKHKHGRIEYAFCCQLNNAKSYGQIEIVWEKRRFQAEQEPYFV
jgi:hypothetical protein